MLSLYESKCIKIGSLCCNISKYNVSSGVLRVCCKRDKGLIASWGPLQSSWSWRGHNWRTKIEWAQAIKKTKYNTYLDGERIFKSDTHLPIRKLMLMSVTDRHRSPDFNIHRSDFLVVVKVEGNKEFVALQIFDIEHWPYPRNNLNNFDKQTPVHCGWVSEPAFFIVRQVKVVLFWEAPKSWEMELLSGDLQVR